MFKIRLKGSQSHWSSPISDLQSGSREIYLSQSFEALKSGSKSDSRGNLSPTNLWSCQYPVQNPGSRRIYLLQKIKGCEEDLLPCRAVQTWVILPYWLIILLITWGLLFIKRSSDYILIRLSSQYYHKGPKRVFCTSQLKHRHPASTTQKYITWGLGRIRTIATPLDWRKAIREVNWGLFASQRTKSLQPCNRLSSQAWKPGVRT